MIRRLNVVTVSSPRRLRSTPGIFRIVGSGTCRSTGIPMASSTCARSEVWRCSSRGGGRVDDVLLDSRIDCQTRAARSGGAGQDLVPRLRLRRQGHDLAVRHGPGLAAEPEPLLHLLVAELDRVLHGGRRNVAGENLAAATAAAPARPAGGVHRDARSLGGVEQRCATRDPNPPDGIRIAGIGESDLDAAVVGRSLHDRVQAAAHRVLSLPSLPVQPLLPSRPRLRPVPPQRNAIPLKPTLLAAPPRASSRASPPAPRPDPSHRPRTRPPTPGWSARRLPVSSPCRGARP